jgi:hypothetical protein
VASKYLSADQILAARDRRTAKVKCPEWGGVVLIGEMGALANARLVEWWQARRRSRIAERDRDAEEIEPESEEPVSCDSPQPAGEAEVPSCDDRDPGADTEASEVETPDDDMSMMTVADQVEWRVRYVAASILDPQSRMPAFDAGQVEALGAKSPAAIQRVYLAALSLNTGGDASREELEKNSPATGPDDSGSV